MRNMSALEIPIIKKGQVRYKKSEIEEGMLSYIILSNFQYTISKNLANHKMDCQMKEINRALYYSI